MIKTTLAAFLVYLASAACVGQNSVIAANSFPISINWNATTKSYTITQTTVEVGPSLTDLSILQMNRLFSAGEMKVSKLEMCLNSGRLSLLAASLKNIFDYSSASELKLNDIGVRTSVCLKYELDNNTNIDYIDVYYDTKSIMGVAIVLDNNKKLDWGITNQGYQDTLDFKSFEPFIGFFASLTTDSSAIKTLGALQDACVLNQKASQLSPGQ